jgi:PAS domain S-box-containing protein
MPRSLEQRLTIGFVIVLVVLIGNAVVCAREADVLHQADGWVSHTYEVLYHLEEISGAMAVAEAGERGFLATGQNSFIEPYRQARLQVGKRLRRLEELTSDNDPQQQRIVQLGRLTSKRFEELDSAIAAAPSSPAEAERLVEASAVTANRVRSVAEAARQEEERLLELRRAAVRRATLIAGMAFTAATLLAVVLLVLVRRLANRSLAEREKHADLIDSQRRWLYTTLTSIGDAVVVTDTRGQVEVLNPIAEKLTGWRASEAKGRHVDEILVLRHESTGAPVVNPATRALREGIIVGLANHTILLTRDGRRLPIDDSASPIRDEEGNALGAVIVFRDVIERKKQEQEREKLLAVAETANRTKDDFIAMVSHELRTPLGVIQGWTELLRLGGLDANAQRRALDVIDRNIRLQAKLVEDLLDISRMATGKLRVEGSEVDLQTVIATATLGLRQAADARGVTVTAEMTESVAVWGDASRLQQVVGNLLSNAIKFTPKGGHVEVELRRNGTDVELAVHDTGIGIAPDQLGRVFERFHQADTGTSRQHGGLGLGLAISRHLVELHGGVLLAESPGLEQGATFTVRLPLRAILLPPPSTRIPAREAQPTSETQDLPLAGSRILVVDDEPDAVEMLATALRQAGADVVPALSAEEALIQFDREPPIELLISDLEMPIQNGYELIRTVRQRPADRGGRTPAIALTAHARIEDRLEAIAAGFDMHLAKPIETRELVLLSSNLLRRSRAPVRDSVS